MVYRVTDNDYTPDPVEAAKPILLSIELEVDPLNWDDENLMKAEFDHLRQAAEEVGEVKKFIVN